MPIYMLGTRPAHVKRMSRSVCRQLAETGSYDTRESLERYVRFMTTAGSHNDSYADCFHVQFFYNWARGVAVERCAGEQNHSTGPGTMAVTTCLAQRVPNMYPTHA